MRWAKCRCRRTSARKLDADAAKLAKEIVSLAPDSDAYKERVRMLESLANTEITRSASVSNRMLDRPTRAMAAMGEGSPVAKTLLDLRGTVETARSGASGRPLRAEEVPRDHSDGQQDPRLFPRLRIIAGRI